MNLDLGTLSGVLGVVLTVVFFFIGYRGTIGARKERAAAANREIVETLLRRFTLDSAFALEYEEIERFIAGKALNNRVKVADVYSMDEIFSLLYSNVVSSDYVGPKIRKSVLAKLSKCFKAPTERQFVSESAEKEAVDKVRSYIEILLGIGSALLAAAASIATAAGAKGWLEGLSSASFRWTLLIALSVSALTAVSLVLFSRLRDRASATKPDEFPSIPSKAHEFENQIVERLRAIGIPFTEHRDLDLVISFKERKIAVELKLFPPSAAKIVHLVGQMDKLLSKYECDEGLIVIASSLPAKIHGMSFGRIRLLSVDEFFKLLTAPAPLRGAS